MRRKILFFSLSLLTFVAGISLTYVFYCGFGNPAVPQIEIKVARLESTMNDPAVSAPDVEQPRETRLNQDIRQIDFKNFTYDWFPKNEDVSKKRIALRDGQNPTVHLKGKKYGPLGVDYQEKLTNVSYADLTGDGKEEAIVTVGVLFYRWQPMCIFVFSEKNKKAVRIWKYETSTYDDLLKFRGLRVEDGKLVIEEFTEGRAYCCAESVLRKTFAWNGKTFEQKNLETFPFNNETKDFKGFPSQNY